jgi:hypothetical protein
MWWTIGKYFLAALLGFKTANLAIWLGLPSLKVLPYGLDLSRFAVFIIVFNLVLYLMNLAKPEAEETK